MLRSFSTEPPSEDGGDPEQEPDVQHPQQRVPSTLREDQLDDLHKEIADLRSEIQLLQQGKANITYVQEQGHQFDDILGRLLAHFQLAVDKKADLWLAEGLFRAQHHSHDHVLSVRTDFHRVEDQFLALRADIELKLSAIPCHGQGEADAGAD